MAGHFSNNNDSPPEEEESWTDALPTCQHSAIGSHQNQTYRSDGSRTSSRESEDFFFHFRTEGSRTYLYAIFDGYDGKRVASFAHQRLPAELLLGQLEGQSEDTRIKAILRQAILTVERSYFETIDSILAERTALSMSLPEGFDQFVPLPPLTGQEEINRLRVIDAKLKGGTALIVALLHHEKLYVANVGDSRALLCTRNEDGPLEVVQVSVDHSLRNDDEVLRLEQLGLATNTFQGEPLFGDSQATRTIGNFSVKGGYREQAELRNASKEPVIADPDIIGGLPVNRRVGFLVMYTHGLWQALEAATGTTQVDRDIALMVEKEFSQQNHLSSVAQAVVDTVVRMHHGAYMNGGKQKQLKRREDITVIVRNFNFPLGQSLGLYIPPRDTDLRLKEYPMPTPIYIPPREIHEAFSGGSSTHSTPVPPDLTPTPNSGGIGTNTSSEGSDQLLQDPSFDEREQDIEAYVDFTEFNMAILMTDMKELCIS